MQAATRSPCRIRAMRGSVHAGTHTHARTCPARTRTHAWMGSHAHMLLQDLTPPKDTNVRVMVVRDHGNIALSHSASVPLVRGSVHNLKCSEAEHLVRLGVLQVLDTNC